MKKILFLLLAFNCAFGEEIYASFNVEASKQSKLALESIGLVQKIPVEIGQKVSKGELLLALDQESEKIALQNAQNSYQLACRIRKYQKQNAKNQSCRKCYRQTKL